MPLINLLKIIPVSTAEDERGFSAMNDVCTDLRNSLNTETTSAILFIKINGSPIDKFIPDSYVKNWLRTHNNAYSINNIGRENELKKVEKKCWNFL